MSNSVQKFFMNEELGESAQKELNQNIIDILELYRLLSIEEKLTVRRKLTEERLF